MNQGSNASLVPGDLDSLIGELAAEYTEICYFDPATGENRSTQANATSLFFGCCVTF